MSFSVIVLTDGHIYIKIDDLVISYIYESQSALENGKMKIIWQESLKHKHIYIYINVPS